MIWNEIGPPPRQAAEPLAQSQSGSAHEELVAEDAVGRVQYGEGGAAGGVRIGKKAAYHALSGALTTKGKRYDDDTGVKSAH